MDDTAAAIYTDLRQLVERLSELQRRHVLTLDDDPSGTRRTVQETLSLLDAAADRVGRLETLDL